MAVVGVDVGGTSLKAALVAEDGRVLGRMRTPTALDAERLAADISDVVAEIGRGWPPVAAVGIGLAASVEQPEGRPVAANNIALGSGLSAAALAGRIGIPVVLDNDGNAATVAEHRLGAGRGHRDIVVVVLGTGVGGGVVVDERLVRGGRGLGAEPGHIVIDHDGPDCPSACPNRGCLEAFIGARALRRDLLAAAEADPAGAAGRALATGAEPGPELVGRLAAEGDEVSRHIIERAGRMLGVGLASLANLFAPSLIAIGGGVAGLGETVLVPARAEYRSRVLPPHLDVPITPALLGAEAGMLGAALLALDLVGEGTWAH